MRELVVCKLVEAAEPVAFATPFVDGKATTAAAAAQSSAYALAESTRVLRGQNPNRRTERWLGEPKKMEPKLF